MYKSATSMLGYLSTANSFSSDCWGIMDFFFLASKEVVDERKGILLVSLQSTCFEWRRLQFLTQVPPKNMEATDHKAFEPS